MKTTLEKIQKASNILRIISKIALILCTLGFAVCVLGFFFLKLSKIDPAKFAQIVNSNGYEIPFTMTLDYIYCACICGALSCGAEMYLAKETETYFKNELAAGTPFTFEGADEMKSLSIKTLVVPLVAFGLQFAAIMVFTLATRQNINLKLGLSIDLGLGLLFLVISLLLRYGAEIRRDNDVIDVTPKEEDIL